MLNKEIAGQIEAYKPLFEFPDDFVKPRNEEEIKKRMAIDNTEIRLEDVLKFIKSNKQGKSN